MPHRNENLESLAARTRHPPHADGYQGGCAGRLTAHREGAAHPDRWIGGRSLRGTDR